MSASTIGSALVARRTELGLEKGQAADKIGMSRTTYSSYEQDAQRPSVDVFPALAEFLNISIEELLKLYGATCIAAVRPALQRLVEVGPKVGEHLESSARLPMGVAGRTGASTSPQNQIEVQHEYERKPTSVAVEPEPVASISVDESYAIESPKIQPGEDPQEAEGPEGEPHFAQTSPTAAIPRESDARNKNSGHKRKKKKNKKNKK